jgi:luciferase family oxidoreductase group 1
MASPVHYSVLDLAPIIAGSTAGESYRHSVEQAQLAEELGYTRYWLAEHHNIPGIASSATAVIIGHIAGQTKRIRVGSGGIMLPNHAPLIIAEQFGTLESLYPGRIDLGIGRAPGGDQATARAIRRNLPGADTFPRDLVELQSYFADSVDGQIVRAIPGQGLHVPLYLLGSSDFSARLAAMLGLPFGFASHFAPDYLNIAIDLYRTNFKPSDQLAEPYVIIGLNVITAESDAQAEQLFTSQQQAFLNLIRGRPTQLQPPVETMLGRWTPEEEAHVRRMMRVSAVGSVESVRRSLEQLRAETGADEFIATMPIYDHATRLRSLELSAAAFGDLGAYHGVA